MKIQITMILENAKPVTAVADSWDDAVAEITRWYMWNSTRGGQGPIGRDLPVFLCDEDAGIPIMERHTVEDCVRRHLIDERVIDDLGGHRRLFAHGATERRDGPPYDAATATGMYDHD